MTPDVPAVVFWSIAALIGLTLQIRAAVIQHKRDKQFRKAYPDSTRSERFWNNVMQMPHYFAAAMLFIFSFTMVEKTCFQSEGGSPEFQRYVAGKQHEYSMEALLTVIIFGGLSLIGLILNAGNTNKENRLR